MKTLLFFLFLFLSLSFAHGACKLPVSEKITIGCTYKCDIFTKTRLKAVGARLGYRVKFTDLSTDDHFSGSLAGVDSLFIPGGADINPKFYLKDVTDDLRQYTEQNLHLVNFTEEGKKRDLFEYTILKRIINQASDYKKFPVLGICRGMQMMSVAQGIPLYLDIKTELGIPNRRHKLDEVSITSSESLMDYLYGDKNFRGYQLHHQGIRVDYYEAHKNDFPSVNVSAFSNQGLVAEAIEYKGMTALGVQYHPEFSLPETAYPIYKWFLTKACEYKASLKVKK
jgi:gamma-glutamyl-gamma-aminobutyrate hydrolase PuuD